LFYPGEFVLARKHLEQAIALYGDRQQYRSYAFFYGQDLGVTCLSYTAWALWYLGYPDQALKRVHEALTLAQELSHPYSFAYALNFAAAVHQHRQEEHLTQEWAEAEIALASEQGFPLWLALGTILRGWALAEQGQRAEGIAQIHQGMAAYRATGAEVVRPTVLATLVWAYWKAGQTEEGLTALAEALEVVHTTGEHVPEAWLYWLKGELTLQKFQVSGSKFQVANPQPLIPNPQAEAEAEVCFQKAIEIASRQSAKSLELRAAVSLSRLWQSQGKKEEAHKRLTEIYGWFTEGFETVDLQEAKALLQKLA
jgi:predicted ATPase